MTLVRAVCWRQRWRMEEAVRRWLWPDRVGFVSRPLPPVAVTLPVPEASRAGAATVCSSLVAAPPVRRVGVVGGPASAAAAGARLAGLDTVTTEDAPPAALADRAAREPWPLLALPAAQLGEVTTASLRALLSRGGTLLITGIDPSATPELQALGTELRVCLPECRSLPEGAVVGVFFSERERELTRELAGAWFESDEARACLVASGPGALACTRQDGRGAAVAWTAPAAGGRIVLTTGASDLVDRGEGKWRAPLAVLVPLMTLRAAYGETAWHAPWPLASITVDDPALDRGLLGLDYDRIAELGRAHGFHLGVATIPRELRLADPRVLDLLRRERDVLSACYHGNDHDSYEFYLETASRHRFPARSLEAQRRKLAEAGDRGARLAREAGFALDRVMVFPHGMCSASLLPWVADHGFLATCNGVDRYPLGTAGPPSDETGARPADLDWSGFPVLGRRPLGAVGELALDLFLGKPAIGFTHRPDMGPHLTPVLEHAAVVNRLGSGSVRWCGLEDLSRHSYLVRHATDECRWDVLMTANEICLHNPGSTARVYRVSRPRLPAGDRLRVSRHELVLRAAREEVDVTVAPGDMAEVTVQRPPSARQLPRPPRGECVVGR